MVNTHELEHTSLQIRQLGLELDWAIPCPKIFLLSNDSDNYPLGNTSVHKILDPSFRTCNRIWVKLGDLRQ